MEIKYLLVLILILPFVSAGLRGVEFNVSPKDIIVNGGNVSGDGVPTELCYFNTTSTVGGIDGTAYDGANSLIDYGSNNIRTTGYVSFYDTFFYVPIGFKSINDGSGSIRYTRTSHAGGNFLSTIYFGYPFYNEYINLNANGNMTAICFTTQSGKVICDQQINTWNAYAYNQTTNIFDIIYTNDIVGRNNVSVIVTTGIWNGTELPDNNLETGWMNMSGNILLYHFNNKTGENDTSIRDFSMRRVNATCITSSCPNFNSTQGVMNGSFSYTTSGTVKYFTVPTFVYPQNMTITAWVKRLDPNINKANKDRIFLGTGGNSFGFYFTTDNSPKNLSITKVGIAGGYSKYGVNDSLWHFVGVTTNGTKACFYLDNNTADCVTWTVDYATSVYTIGSRGATEEMNGSIDELAIWNRSINSTDMLKIYNKQFPSYNNSNVTSSLTNVDMTNLVINTTGSTVTSLQSTGQVYSNNNKVCEVTGNNCPSTTGISTDIPLMDDCGSACYITVTNGLITYNACSGGCGRP